MRLREAFNSLEAKFSQATTELEQSKLLISALKEEILEVQRGHELNRSEIAIHAAEKLELKVRNDELKSELKKERMRLK